MHWKILEQQPELQPYEAQIEDRMRRFSQKRAALLANGQRLSDFANGYLYFGLHKTESGWVYREWAPAAESLCLIGDFNGWNRESHPLQKVGDGSWEILLNGITLPHGSRYKVAVTAHGQTQDRIPLYANFVRKSPENGDYAAIVWDPPQKFRWTDAAFSPQKNVPPFIYEAHVGMAVEEERIGTYREFADNILPRIVRDGYNTVQLMAVMEHPYYGSFGYQVSNFFAPSSYFGTPDDLKYLIDRAHALGLSVLLDLVHSHAVKNTFEGINLFDGTVTQFFKEGKAGDHPAWGSKVFDYGKTGVLHFLLSNIKYWLEEFHFDGFRFDGVTSMLYRNHGLQMDFGSPEGYFSNNIDWDAVTYCQLATQLVKQLRPRAVLIAEDMSAMPGMALPVEAGGLGFDYRLNMGLPDFFIRTIKEKSDGNWSMQQLCWELIARRKGEKCIGYAESHDQALVGDQTLIFRLAQDEMYTAMRTDSGSLSIERAIALHKMLRLVTVCAGGEGYLNFMGNEFGHPEWIDFPREGNGWSHKYARRQWSLAEDETLRYRQLGAFDRAMVALMRNSRILKNTQPLCLHLHEEDQILVFERGGFLFAFNFHPTRSQKALFLPASVHKQFQVALSTDESAFGGFDRTDKAYRYTAISQTGQKNSGFLLYLPARTAVVLRPVAEHL